MQETRKSTEPLVRPKVRELLESSPAFGKLAPDKRARMADDMVAVGGALIPADKATSPTFVADLIQGTFDAIVDASIQQMEAYADLLADVAKSVDQFMADNVSEEQARDYLAIQGLASPGEIDPKLWETLVVPAACRELAERRQKLLATMVLMGINRIVVTDGKIRPKPKDSVC